jgi:ABC-type phosphate transport system substrate-binding protein
MCRMTGYNLPELAGMELVLDYDTIAAIYLNNITMWDDDRIKALNSPQVAAVLPSTPIIVVTQSLATVITTMFTLVLSAKVPAFAAQVPSTKRAFPCLFFLSPQRQHCVYFVSLF